MLKATTRTRLATYAAMLGRGSLAAEALATYDAAKAAGSVVEVLMGNNGFALKVDGELRRFGA